MSDIIKAFEDKLSDSFDQIDDDSLGELGSEIARIRDVRDNIKLFEEKISQLKEEEIILSDSITDILSSKGLSEIKLKDGQKLTTKEDIKCGITKENEQAAFTWIREQGDGDIIENKISVDFKVGEDETSAKFKELARNSGLIPNETSKIHYQRLKAYLKGKMEDGVNFDEKLFSIFRINKVNIKRW